MANNDFTKAEIIVGNMPKLHRGKDQRWINGSPKHGFTVMEALYDEKTGHFSQGGIKLKAKTYKALLEEVKQIAAEKEKLLGHLDDSPFRKPYNPEDWEEQKDKPDKERGKPISYGDFVERLNAEKEIKKYMYYTHKIYTKDKDAILDFMKVYNCTYEQAKDYVPKELVEVVEESRFYIDKKEVEETKYESICIYDIQGKWDSYWCDYFFDDNTTYFGGSGWHKIPPWKTDYIPTDKEARAYADAYMKNLETIH